MRRARDCGDAVPSEHYRPALNPEFVQRALVNNNIRRIERERLAKEERERKRQAFLESQKRREQEERERKAREATAEIRVTPSMSVRHIIRLVAAKHQLMPEDIVGKRRLKPVVTARHEAILLVRKAKPKFSLGKIGKIFNCDHSTVYSALMKSGWYDT